MQRGSLGLVNVKSRHFDVVQTSVPKPVALTSDVAQGLFFWADNMGNIYKSDGQQSSTLYSGKLQYLLWYIHLWLPSTDGSFLACLSLTGESGITSLACEWLTGNLFWVNQRTKSINMMAADSSDVVMVLGKNISPLEIVLLPVERWASSSVSQGFRFFFVCLFFNNNWCREWKKTKFALVLQIFFQIINSLCLSSVLFSTYFVLLFNITCLNHTCVIVLLSSSVCF